MPSMSSIDLSTVMRTAWQDVEAGRLEQALAAARQVLQHDPSHADAHYMMGLLLNQARQPPSSMSSRPSPQTPPSPITISSPPNCGEP